jgi:HD-GYP domain-containing protein (c-di-GMP phosphodiesterase class II)
MNGEGPKAKAHGSQRTPRAGEMEILLTNLAGLMEDKWGSQKEVEDITQELMQSFEDLHLYSRIATQIKSLRFSNEMLQRLTEELLETMRADIAFAALPERKEYNSLVVKEEAPHRTPDIQGFTDSLIAAIPLDAASLEEDYFIVNDSMETPAYKGLHPDPYRFLAVRIRHHEKLHGWLGLVAFNLEEIFRRSELRLLGSMAEQLAAVLTNTDLYLDLEHFVINVVKSLVYAIEAKDVYTSGHSERVSHYSMRIADHLGLDAEQKKVIRWASILHDVGKIGIPESILNKPGALDDEEYEIIKSHPEKGYDILKPLEQLSSSLPGILHHHERYDGRGYPHGLKGAAIPRIARIIAVADTFDAITSKRPYRPAKSHQEALAIVEEVAGTQLDARLVEVFARIIREEMETEERRVRAV